MVQKRDIRPGRDDRNIPFSWCLACISTSFSTCRSSHSGRVAFFFLTSTHNFVLGYFFRAPWGPIFSNPDNLCDPDRDLLASHEPIGSIRTNPCREIIGSYPDDVQIVLGCFEMGQKCLYLSGESCRRSVTGGEICAAILQKRSYRPAMMSNTRKEIEPV